MDWVKFLKNNYGDGVFFNDNVFDEVRDWIVRLGGRFFIRVINVFLE